MPSSDPPRIDPSDLEATLRVLASLAHLEEDDPDFVTVRRATARMFKEVKRVRRRELREVAAAEDAAVIGRASCRERVSIAV